MKTRSAPVYRVQTFPRLIAEGNAWRNEGHAFETEQEAVDALHRLLDQAEPGYYDGRLRAVEETTIIETNVVLRVNATFVGLKRVSH